MRKRCCCAISPRSPASGPFASAVAAAYPVRVPSVGDIRVFVEQHDRNPLRTTAARPLSRYRLSAASS